MPPDAFPGGKTEKLKNIRAEIGEVGSDAKLLNDFMLKRFQEVKNRLDADFEQTEELNGLSNPQDSRGDSSRLWQLFRVSQLS